MTAKHPTASGISALLKKAGFDRAEQTSRATLGCSFTDGFRVTGDTYYSVARVRHQFLTIREHHDPSVARRKLAEYAETITAAGWAVEAGEWELVVTARKDG